MFGIIGEVGGITSVIIVLIALIAEPVTKLSVFFKFMSRLFLARSTNQKFFIIQEHKNLKKKKLLSEYSKKADKKKE